MLRSLVFHIFSISCFKSMERKDLKHLTLFVEVILHLSLTFTFLLMFQGIFLEYLKFLILVHSKKNVPMFQVWNNLLTDLYLIVIPIRICVL